MSKKFLIFFILISLFFVVFRIYLISTLDFNPDEKILAIEISKVSWTNIPVHFFGYGWGENVGLGYLSLPIIKIFPQASPIIIFRSVNLLFNLLFIFFIYLLSKELFNKKIASIAALFTVINPWSIYTAVFAFNAYLLPFIYICSIYLFLLGIKTKKILFYLMAFVLFSFSFYTYSASFIYTPLILILITFVYYKKINKKYFFIGTAMLSLLALPIFLFYLKNQFGLFGADRFLFFSLPQLVVTRFSNISIFSSYEGFGIVLNYALDYLLHFNLLTLLYKDGQIHFYNFFYFWDIIFILLGLALSLKKYKLKKL